MLTKMLLEEDELVFKDNDSLYDYDKKDLDAAILYILNNFCNKQKHRGKDNIDVQYKLSRSSLEYYDDDDLEYSEPGYYYEGYFTKYSPQLRDKRDVAKFELGFWLFEYDTFGKLKKYVMNYNIPKIWSHTRATRVKDDPEESDDVFTTPRDYSPDDHIIDIGMDLDKENGDIADLDLDIDIDDID